MEKTSASAPSNLVAGANYIWNNGWGVLSAASNNPTDQILGNSSLKALSHLYSGTGWDRQRSLPGSLGVPATPYSGMQSLAITTATTTAVKASAGVVGTLSNASGAATGTITVYDSTTGSGKTLWSGTLATGQVLPLGLPCGTGITIVTAAADAIAVSYA